jgi:hypothetical protein
MTSCQVVHNKARRHAQLRRVCRTPYPLEHCELPYHVLHPFGNVPGSQVASTKAATTNGTVLPIMGACWCLQSDAHALWHVVWGLTASAVCRKRVLASCRGLDEVIPHVVWTQILKAGRSTAWQCESSRLRQPLAQCTPHNAMYPRRSFDWPKAEVKHQVRYETWLHHRPRHQNTKSTPWCRQNINQ